MSKIKRYINHPITALEDDIMKHHPNWLSDERYTTIVWRTVMTYPLNLKDPRTFSEKIQWLKLHDHNPLYTTLVDKNSVKQWVAEKIGAEYVIPTLAVYQSVDEIDLDKLPNQFVLKCNHDSGSVVFCEDKKTFDIGEAKRKLAHALNTNFYKNFREWAYRDVKPLIIAEPYLKDGNSPELTDYKLYSFNGGDIKCIFCGRDRFINNGKVRVNMYDTNWKRLPFEHGHPNFEPDAPRPEKLDEMLQLAHVLGEAVNNDFVRIDFYEINKKVYFGEFTFYPGGGYEVFKPIEWDGILGDWIHMDKSKY